MSRKLLHIFRNNPIGRETFLQALHFCKQAGAAPFVYIPEHTKFLMHFNHVVVQVDLDRSYLTAPHTARERAQALLDQEGVRGEFLEPAHFAASTLPTVPVDFDFMSCPRSISDLSTKIGPGYIGTKVRKIVKEARFPVLIGGPLYKGWKSLTVFFGGSANAVRALRLALRIGERSEIPVDIVTMVERGGRAYYKEIIEAEGLEEPVGEKVRDWIFFEKGTLEENLYGIPSDTLLVLGAYGHGVIKDVLFGSKLEKIQANVPNTLLIVGPLSSTGG